MSDTDCTKSEILVLAADELPRRAFERTLTDHGYEPLLARDLGDAMALAEENAFALGVVDTHNVSLDSAIALARRLFANNPAARAIIVHDVSIDQEPCDGSSNRIRILYRPFPMLEFISSVDDALTVKR